MTYCFSGLESTQPTNLAELKLTMIVLEPQRYSFLYCEVEVPSSVSLLRLLSLQALPAAGSLCPLPGNYLLLPNFFYN